MQAPTGTPTSTPTITRTTFRASTPTVTHTSILTRTQIGPYIEPYTLSKNQIENERIKAQGCPGSVQTKVIVTLF